MYSKFIFGIGMVVTSLGLCGREEEGSTLITMVRDRKGVIPGLTLPQLRYILEMVQDGKKVHLTKHYENWSDKIEFSGYESSTIIFGCFNSIKDITIYFEKNGEVLDQQPWGNLCSDVEMISLIVK